MMFIHISQDQFPLLQPLTYPEKKSSLLRDSLPSYLDSLRWSDLGPEKMAFMFDDGWSFLAATFKKLSINPAMPGAGRVSSSLLSLGADLEAIIFVFASIFIKEEKTAQLKEKEFDIILSLLFLRAFSKSTNTELSGLWFCWKWNNNTNKRTKSQSHKGSKV